MTIWVSWCVHMWAVWASRMHQNSNFAGAKVLNVLFFIVFPIIAFKYFETFMGCQFENAFARFHGFKIWSLRPQFKRSRSVLLLPGPIESLVANHLGCVDMKGAQILSYFKHMTP